MDRAENPKETLNFNPFVIKKKGARIKNIVQPFPSLIKSGELYCGIFTGLSVEINDETAIRNIYENGFYGKGSQSRGVPNIIRKNIKIDEMASQENTEVLVLQLEEAFFLSYYVNVLKINTVNGDQLEWQEFLKIAEVLNPNFLEFLAAYLYLKSKGWVVKSGLKFGGDFLIYKKGPRYFHASFIVSVKNENDSTSMVAKDIQGMVRVAETSKKHLLILDVTKPKDFKMECLEDLRDLYVSETIIKRFNYSSFVQSTNKKKKVAKDNKNNKIKDNKKKKVAKDNK